MGNWKLALSLLVIFSIGLAVTLILVFRASRFDLIYRGSDRVNTASPQPSVY